MNPFTPDFDPAFGGSGAIDIPAVVSQAEFNVHIGLAAWTNHTFTLGERCSNAGNAYRCITAGTSTVAPTGTSADSTPGGTAHFMWLSAIDYTSLQAYADTNVTPRTSDHVITIWNDSLIQCVAGTALMYLPNDGGTGIYSTTFRPAPGDGWRDNATALAYDATKGVAIQLPVSTDSSIPYIFVEAPNVTFDGLQFKDPRSTGTSTPLTIAGANPTIRNCIFDVNGRTSVKNLELAAPNPTVVNNLFIDRHPTAPQNLLGVTTGVCNIVDCLFVAVAAAGTAQAIYVEDTTNPGRIIRNCGVFGWSEPVWGGATNIITADHCITDATYMGGRTIDGGSNLVSKSLTNQVVNTATDLRLKPGADASGAGVVSALAPTDIFGRTRASPPSIGPFELIIATADTAEAATATSTQSVTVIQLAATAETGAASDAQTANAIRLTSGAEAAAAADAPSSNIVTTAAVAEAATPADAPSSTAVSSAATAETTSATDAPARTAVFVTAAAEAVSATDAPANTAVRLAATAETVSATDAADATTVATTSVVAETVSASDAPTATVITVAAVAEPAAANEVATGSVTTAAAIVEAAATTDLQTTTAALTANAVESAAAVASQTAASPAQSDVAEAVSATDTQTTTAVRLAATTEATSAADAPSATIITSAAVAEAASATDARNATTTPAGLQVVEATAATAVQTASVIVVVSAAETAGATDQPVGAITTAAAVAESAIPSDFQTTAKSQSAAASDVAAISDTQAAIGTLAGSAVEVAAAISAESALAVLDAAGIETASATDGPAGAILAQGSVAEAVAPADSQDAFRGQPASAIDVADATDAQDFEPPSNIGVATPEVAHATDVRTANVVLHAGVSEAAAATDKPADSLQSFRTIGTESVFRRPLVIYREAPGAYVDGVWQSGWQTEFTILANVQPATLFDYDRMRAESGGQRLERMIRIYTGTELLLSDPASVFNNTEQAGDIVEYATPLANQSGRYRVIGQAIWAGGMNLDHFRYLAAMEPAP